MVDIIVSVLILIPFMLFGAALGCGIAEMLVWAGRKIKALF